MSASPNAGVIAERQEAARLLLSQPLIVAGGFNGDRLPLIRQHARWLTDEFSHVLGYRLVVEAGFARLYKTAVGDASRPARRDGTGNPLTGTGSPLTPRAYTYLTLAVSVLLTAREQMLLSGLVADVRAAAAEAGIELGDDRAERRALTAALRTLVRWGVISEDDGNVAGYAENAAHEALLTVRREVVRHLIAGPLRQAQTPDELVELAAAAPVGGARHRVRRKLVETPVVYRDELPDEDREWMAQYQRREEDVLGGFLGVTFEIRAEGIALFGPELTDRKFPAEGTVAQAALLSVSTLVERLRPANIPNPREHLIVAVPIPDGLLEEVVAGHLDRHKRRWAKEWVANPEALIDEVRGLLVEMRLIAAADPVLSETPTAVDGWVLLAAASRYAAKEKIVDPNLFGDKP